MRRRQFVGIALGALASPSVARSDAAVPVVGWLDSGSYWDAAQQGFQSGLAELGYQIGRNVRFEYRFGGGKYDQMQGLADELVALHVNAIVALANAPAIEAAEKSTSTIPIICITGGDPVRSGRVQSMNKPGGNLTGINILSNELVAKRIELLHGLLPEAVPMAVLVTATPYRGREDDLKQAEDAVRKLRREFILLEASNKSEIENAFTAASKRKAALFVWADVYFTLERALIVSLAARYSLPCIYGNRLFAEIGGLISYGHNFLEVWRLLGNYTGKVLRGASPAELPILQPTKYELIINLKTARMLGLTILPTLLASADEVIE